MNCTMMLLRLNINECVRVLSYDAHTMLIRLVFLQGEVEDESGLERSILMLEHASGESVAGT